MPAVSSTPLPSAKNSAAWRGKTLRRKSPIAESRFSATRRISCLLMAPTPRGVFSCLFCVTRAHYPAAAREPQLRSRFDSLIALRADTKFSRADALKLPAPSDYDITILALFVGVRDRKDTC